MDFDYSKICEQFETFSTEINLKNQIEEIKSGQYYTEMCREAEHTVIISESLYDFLKKYNYETITPELLRTLTVLIKSNL